MRFRRQITEAIPDMSDVDHDQAHEMMRKATEKWRAHGFDLEFSELGYEGDRNDVADYLDTLGWKSTGKSMSELVAENSLPPIPQGNDSVLMADTIYYTSIK